VVEGWICIILSVLCFEWRFNRQFESDNNIDGKFAKQPLPRGQSANELIHNIIKNPRALLNLSKETNNIIGISPPLIHLQWAAIVHNPAGQAKQKKSNKASKSNQSN
jgi:hypothetical protein